MSGQIYFRSRCISEGSVKPKATTTCHLISKVRTLFCTVLPTTITRLGSFVSTDDLAPKYASAKPELSPCKTLIRLNTCPVSQAGRISLTRCRLYALNQPIAPGLFQEQSRDTVQSCCKSHPPRTNDRMPPDRQRPGSWSYICRHQFFGGIPSKPCLTHIESGSRR